MFKKRSRLQKDRKPAKKLRIDLDDNVNISNEDIEKDNVLINKNEFLKPTTKLIDFDDETEIDSVLPLQNKGKIFFKSKKDSRRRASNQRSELLVHKNHDDDINKFDRDWYLQDETLVHSLYDDYSEAEEEADENSQNSQQQHEVADNGDSDTDSMPHLLMKKSKFDETSNEKNILVHRLTPPFLDSKNILSSNVEIIDVVRDRSGDLFKYSKDGSYIVNEKRKNKDRKENAILQTNLNDSIINNFANKDSNQNLNREESNKFIEGLISDYNPETIKLQRESLPAYKAKNDLLTIINENQVVIVVGETGSGKTTQLPQFLHEAGYNNNGIIGITQPRRVAAISVSKRVSEEMNVKLGQEVGYSIRFEDQTSSKTQVKFMTDGILLRETLMDPDLNDYSCIIMDEAHERSLNTDILFGIFKKLLARRRDLKLIITSATMNTLKFSNFFGNAIFYHIPGKTFPVDILFQSVPSVDYVESAMKQALRIHLAGDSGDILIFMTGQEDIEITGDLIEEELTNLQKVDKSIPPLDILPIYSTLSAEAQSKVFSKSNNRKCIIATNIAETSLTVDGVCFVIDSGLMKLKVYNPKLNMDSLRIVPISIAQANQRSGRAGRTSPGKAYRLYTLSSAENEMWNEPIPEIQRSNLMNTILLLKNLNIINIQKFPFLDKPSIESLQTSEYELWSAGALDNFGYLTNLGKEMCKYPIDPALSKLLIISTFRKFQCTKEIVKIIAMLSIPPIFERPRDSELKKRANKSREKFIIHGSDHLTLMNIYDQFLKNNRREQWCKREFLNWKALRQAVNIHDQLINLIGKSSKIYSTTDYNIIRECICAAFYQNGAEFHKYNQYRHLRSGLEMWIPSSSALNGMGELPKFVVFHELLMTNQKQQLSCITEVSSDWLCKYGDVFYSLRRKGLSGRENQRIKEAKFQTLIEKEKLGRFDLK